ncbi:MAG: hypothetical protein AAFV46_00125 [Cyanobacteria bacterium J06635_11]
MKAVWNWLKANLKLLVGALAMLAAIFYLGRRRSRVENILDAREDASDAHTERAKKTAAKQRAAHQRVKEKNDDIQRRSKQSHVDAEMEIHERGAADVIFDSLFAGKRPRDDS